MFCLRGLEDRPMSVVSTSSNGTEAQWRRRQTIKRGVTRKVALTSGNFIAEYTVPTAVYNAIEPKWKEGSKTTEFSCVYFSNGWGWLICILLLQQNAVHCRHMRSR